MAYKATYSEMEEVAKAFCVKVGIDSEGMNAVDAIDCYTTTKGLSWSEARRQRQIARSWDRIAASHGWI